MTCRVALLGTPLNCQNWTVVASPPNRGLPPARCQAGPSGDGNLVLTILRLIVDFCLPAWVFSRSQFAVAERQQD